MIYLQEKLEKLKNEIASVAQKTGISSATKIAMLVPQNESVRLLQNIFY